MDTLLVTGGAGFVGSCFVRRAVARGARVVSLDKLTYAGNLDSLSDVVDDPRHIFVEGDIGDRPLVDKLLKQFRPRAIVNFAAESHVDRSIDGPAQFVVTNTLGAFQLLEAAYDYQYKLNEPQRTEFRFLQVSTDEVYGSADGGELFTEETPYRPSSPYAASKAAADHFARAYHRTFRLPVLTTHGTNTYGPYQFPEKLIPLMIFNALEGRPLPVYGDGQQIRDWLHLEDHCHGIEMVLEKGRPGESYNIAGGCSRTNLEVVEAICDLIDDLRPKLWHRPCRGLIRFVEDRPGHDCAYAIDAGKIRRQLGWQPRKDFAVELENTVRWYLDHVDWTWRAREFYQQERLGLGKHADATGLMLESAI